METWSCSLPTSMPAAFGSRTGSACIGGVFRLASGVPDPSLRRTNLPNGNTACAAAPNKPSVADQNHSLPRAALARQRARRSRCTPQTNTPARYQVQGRKSRILRAVESLPVRWGCGHAALWYVPRGAPPSRRNRTSTRRSISELEAGPSLADTIQPALGDRQNPRGGHNHPEPHWPARSALRLHMGSLWDIAFAFKRLAWWPRLQPHGARAVGGQPPLGSRPRTRLWSCSESPRLMATAKSVSMPVHPWLDFPVL
jgi:hypothetical protein